MGSLLAHALTPTPRATPTTACHACRVDPTHAAFACPLFEGEPWDATCHYCGHAYRYHVLDPVALVDPV